MPYATLSKPAWKLKIRKASLRICEASDLRTQCKRMSNIYSVWNCIVSQCIEKQRQKRAVILRKRLERFLNVCHSMRQFTSQFAEDIAACDKDISFEGLMAAFLSLYIDVVLLSGDITNGEKRIDIVVKLLYFLRQWPEKIVDALLGVTVVSDCNDGSTFRSLIWRVTQEAGVRLTNSHYVKFAILIKRWSPLILMFEENETWSFLWKIPVPKGMENFLKKKLKTQFPHRKSKNYRNIKTVLKKLSTKCQTILLQKMDKRFKRALEKITSQNEPDEEEQIGGEIDDAVQAPETEYFIDLKGMPLLEKQVEQEQESQLHMDVDELIRNSQFTAGENDGAEENNVTGVDHVTGKDDAEEDNVTEKEDDGTEEKDVTGEEHDGTGGDDVTGKDDAEGDDVTGEDDGAEEDYVTGDDGAEEDDVTGEDPVDPAVDVKADVQPSKDQSPDKSKYFSKTLHSEKLSQTSDDGKQPVVILMKNVLLDTFSTLSDEDHNDLKAQSVTPDRSNGCMFETLKDRNVKRLRLSVTPHNNDLDVNSVPDGIKRSPPRLAYNGVSKRTAEDDPSDKSVATSDCDIDSAPTNHFIELKPKKEESVKIPRPATPKNNTNTVGMLTRSLRKAINTTSEQRPNDETPVKCAHTELSKPYKERSSTAKKRYNLRSIQS